MNNKMIKFLRLAHLAAEGEGDLLDLPGRGLGRVVGQEGNEPQELGQEARGEEHGGEPLLLILRGEMQAGAQAVNPAFLYKHRAVSFFFLLIFLLFLFLILSFFSQFGSQSHPYFFNYPPMLPRSTAYTSSLAAPVRI